MTIAMIILEIVFYLLLVGSLISYIRGWLSFEVILNILVIYSIPFLIFKIIYSILGERGVIFI